MNKLLKKILVFTLAVISVISFGMFAVACNEEEPPEEETKVTFSLNYHLKSLSLYETLQLKVDGFDNVTYTSDNLSVVAVVDGLVTANAYGSATVTATIGEYSDTCIINVLNEGKVPSIRANVDDDGFNLLTNDSYQLDCYVRFNNQKFVDGTFSFSSSDSETVSVSGSGLVTAKKIGDAVITVTANWRDFDSIYLVKEIPVSVNPNLSMELTVADKDIYTMSGEIDGITYSDTTTLSYKVVLDGDDITSTADVNWVVGNAEILSVAENLTVTANNRGSTQIYYEYTVGGKTFKSLPVTVTVNAPTKTIDNLVIYEIGTEDNIPASLFDGVAYGLKIKSADYTAKANFSSGNVYIDEDVQIGFKGQEITFTVDTNLYAYSVNVLFVTHAINTADEFVAFLNSYSGNKSNVDANLTNTYYAVLENDIDLSGATLPSKSYNNDRFFGVFNGLGHALTNVTVNSTGGIFGGLHQGTIENFAVIGVSITKTYSSYAILAGYLYPSAIVRNIYVDAEINQLTFFRGLFYSGTNGKVSNIIAKLEYGLINTSDNKFAFGVSSDGFSIEPTQLYAVGNATAYSGISNGKNESDLSANYDAETQDVVYATMYDFYSANKSQITAENGFSKYWKVSEGSLWFGNNMLYMDSDYLEEVQYVQTWTYDYDNMTVYSTNEDGSPNVQSNWKIKDSVTVDIAGFLGKTPTSVEYGGTTYEVESGKIIINPADYTNGSTYVFTAQCADKVYYLPITFVSQYITSNDEFKEFLKPNSGISSLVTKDWYAVLANDLDFSKETAALTEMGQGTRFYGTIDGQGHTISNLTLDQALFGYNFGTIKNIAFVNVSSTNYGSNKGLSYGAFGSQTGVISNVYMSITATNAAAYKGVIDQIFGVKISNCVFDVKYADGNTATTTYAINGAASSASANLTNVYFLGNADQIQPGDVTAPYATGTFAKAVADGTVNLSVENGFSDSWRVVADNITTTVYFGNNVVDVFQANV